ncbi:MAG: hypothetical protein JJ846_007875 [Prochlorococcus marinus CUG1437]|nr:hypothetical protein [Prochlorococcus marinus CUG1437]
MISDIEIIYGLANRSKNYGIKNTFSDPKSLSLKELYDQNFDGFDGAEAYEWNKYDLNFFKSFPNSKIFTKIDLLKVDQEEIEKIIVKHSINRKTYLNGIYMHNRVSDETLWKYKNLIETVKLKYDIKFGISIYSQDDIKLILENEIKVDILQLPLNLNNLIDTSELVNNGCHIYGRSIFLQGIYFTNEYQFFRQKTIDKINYQKFILNDLAKKNKMSLGQFLFSSAIHKAKKNQFKGIIIGSTDKKRLINYLKNHKKLIKVFNYEEYGYDLVDNVLADPRKWKN